MQQYLQLLKDIQEKGTYKPAARENMPGTQSLFGAQLRFNLQDGFPLLTTKKMFWKGVVIELLWFLKGDTNIKYLIDNGVNIWNEDAYNYYLKLRKESGHDGGFTFDQFIELIKVGNNPFRIKNKPDYKLGDCGYQYGKVWRKWEKWVDESGADNGVGVDDCIDIDQIANLIKGLKESPQGRRHIVTAWDPAHDQDLALTWCHALFQFNCRPLGIMDRKVLLSEKPSWEGQFYMIDEDPDGSMMDVCDEENIPKYYLDCQLYQRSADVFLGVPFNIASYALLTEIIAKICNMIPGEFIHTFGDVHIYDNHKEAVEEQLKREPGELPKLEFDITMDFDNLILDDFELINYNPQPSIKAELSTGLKK